jgi:antitoxin HicB
MTNVIFEVHSGSSFDDFLAEEGLQEEVESAAIKRVLAWQFEQEMGRQQKTKKAMAKELKTSRSQLDRLLDPQNTAVSLDTLARAARVLGKRLVLEIRDRRPVRKTLARAVDSAAMAAKAEALGSSQGSARGGKKGSIPVSKHASER